MKRTSLLTSLLLILLSTIALGACAELDEPATQVETAPQVQRGVSVVPTFSIDGVDALPDDLIIDSLGFTVSEIRLEPLTGPAGAVAYTAVTPQRIAFNVAEGDGEQRGESIELPRSGRYLVSIRMEPMREGEAQKPSSFALRGFIAQNSSRVDPRYADDSGDRPGPHPFDGGTSGGDAGNPGDPVEESHPDALEDSPEELQTWTPFHYKSERASFFPLGEVEFEPGEQRLHFSFDLHKWAAGLVEPISRAVEVDTSLQDPSYSGVDISRYLDSHGHGPEDFLSRGRVNIYYGF